MCVFACPIGAISIDRIAGALKCDLCGGNPYCARVCPRKAIEFTEYDRVGMNKKRAGVARLLGAAILKEGRMLDIAKEL
jgi:Fe-S-cluster-containing hydrogenase component 2